MNRDKVISQIRRLAISSDALSQVVCVLEHINSLGLKIDDELYSPLVSGAVTAYARNFVSADGLGPLPNKYEKFENLKYQETHKIVMHVRNKIYAHRDLTEKPKSISDLYEVNVWFEDNNLCLQGSMIDINHEYLSDFYTLAKFQENMVKNDIADKLNVLGTGGYYEEGKIYVLGKNFP